MYIPTVDNICFKYSDMPAGKTIYVDMLQTNIIGSLAVPYIEVQEIGQISYRSLHTVIIVGKKWITIIARIIPGVSIPHGYEL